jgi:hypothetical protein
MDAGLRDNFGQETTLRFIDNFKNWIAENTSGVLILQIRDRQKDNWRHPLETGTITDILLKPATMLQNNWFRLQDYFQNETFGSTADSSRFKLQRLTFTYVPKTEEKGAALSFHLTASEKKDVIASFNTEDNQKVLKEFITILK